MSAISDNLIHFLARSVKENPNKQFEIFKSIIENGLRCSPETIRFDTDGTCFLNYIICFTDIPLNECNEHTSIYGQFGIGFKKSYVKRVGGNPVSYFVDHHPVVNNTDTKIAARGALLHNLKLCNIVFNKLYALTQKNPPSGLSDNSGNEILSSIELKHYCAEEILCSSFYKQMGDLGPARDETKEIDLYYKEREWRILPSELASLAGMYVEKPAKTFHFFFERSDLNMIVVPNEQIRHEVIKYLLGLKTAATERLKLFGDNMPPVVIYDELQRW